MKRKILLTAAKTAAGTLAAAVLCLSFFRHAGEAPKTETSLPPRTERRTLVVRASEGRARTETFPAVFKGCRQAEIRPQIRGAVARIFIEEGAEVRRNQPLFLLDQAPYLAALKTAHAEVGSAEAREATARLTLSGKESLFAENVISEFELQCARNALREAESETGRARAARERAGAELEFTVIKSPLDGVAGMIPRCVGEMADPGAAEALVRVSDDSEIRVYFSVPARRMTGGNAPAPGSEARLLLDDGSPYPHAGTIDVVSRIENSDTGTVSVRAVFPNPEHRLRDGGNGRVSLVPREEKCIVIPRAATFEIQNRTFVYRVENGVASAVSVEVENEDGGAACIVRSGLREGDEIIASGAGLAREGERVGKN